MNLIEGLECRQFLSASPVADLAQEGKVAELARTEPGAVSRLARRDSAPAATTSRRREPGDNNGGSTQGPTNPVAVLATGEGGGAAVSELARSEPGAVAELARSGSDGENGGGENGGGTGGGGDTDREPNPVAELAKSEGGAAVSELARSEPGAVAALVRSGAGGENGGGENGGGENGGGENGGGGDADREPNPVAELAKSEGGAAVSELARSEPGAVAEFSRSRIRPATRR